MLQPKPPPYAAAFCTSQGHEGVRGESSVFRLNIHLPLLPSANSPLGRRGTRMPRRLCARGSMTLRRTKAAYYLTQKAASLSDAAPFLFHPPPPGRNHGTALHALGGAGLHIAAAEAAGAVHQLRTFPAKGQSRAVCFRRGADAFVQRGNVLGNIPRHVRLACLKEQTAAGFHVLSHGRSLPPRSRRAGSFRCPRR